MYGPEFWDDSDSSSEEDEDSSSDSYGSEQQRDHRSEFLNRHEKKEFRDSQRASLKKMLLKCDRPKLLLSVIDSGVGIRVVDQMKLFKLFGTIKSTRKLNTKGVGLGLSITKMICEEFGG